MHLLNINAQFVQTKPLFDRVPNCRLIILAKFSDFAADVVQCHLRDKAHLVMQNFVTMCPNSVSSNHDSDYTSIGMLRVSVSAISPGFIEDLQLVLLMGTSKALAR